MLILTFSTRSSTSRIANAKKFAARWRAKVNVNRNENGINNANGEVADGELSEDEYISFEELGDGLVLALYGEVGVYAERSGNIQ